MDMMIDPSVQLAESGAASAAAANTNVPLALNQLFTETPILATAISESEPPGTALAPRLSMGELAVELSENSALRFENIWSQVDFHDPASLIALNMAIGEYKAETSAASGIAAAEARALKNVGEKLLAST